MFNFWYKNMKKYTHLYISFLSLLALLTFGANSVWGAVAETVTLTVTAESSPSKGGYVYVNDEEKAPKKYELTSDYATQKGTSVGSNWTGYTTVSKDFYLYAKAETDYSFKGWSKNASDNSGNTTNGLKVTLSGKKNETKSDGPYYAIFAKYKASTNELDFDNVFLNSGTQTKTFTIACHNVGDSWSATGLSGTSASEVTIRSPYRRCSLQRRTQKTAAKY